MDAEVMEASGQAWFRALLGRFNGLFSQVILSGLVIAIIGLASPLFVMFVYDRVIGAHATDALTPLVAGAVLAACTEFVLRLMRASTLSWLAARVDYVVGAAVFDRLLRMPVIFTERASVAAQISRLKAFESVRDFFTGPLFLTVMEVPFSLVIIAALVVVAGPVAIVPVVAGILYGLLILAFRGPIRTAMRLSGKVASLRQQAIIETFEKMEGLRAGGLTSVWFRQFRDLSGKASLTAFHAAWLVSLMEALSHGIYVLSGMAALSWSVVRVWDGVMTSGALIAAITLTWRALSPLQSLCNALPRFEQIGNAVSQVNRLMEIETENVENNAPAILNGLRGRVTFSHVGLRYTKDSDPVFSGLSFDVKPGYLAAIAGGNGSGKSTVLKLVNGLYRPQAGSISLDGIDIRQLDPRDLRRNVTYFSQHPVVFHGTIADNMRLSRPLATADEIFKALERACLDEYVRSLPQGIDTAIGLQGVDQLPTGVAYNLALARSYLSESKIMLFDELPYALLNSRTGEAFKDMLRQWKGQRTVIIVTHREDYLGMADMALLLRSGQMPLSGRPDRIIDALYEKNERAA